MNQVDLLTGLPNNQAGFEWKVFSLGHGNKIQVDCEMTVKNRVLTPTTSTIPSETTSLSTPYSSSASSSTQSPISFLNQTFLRLEYASSEWTKFIFENSQTENDRIDCLMRNEVDQFCIVQELMFHDQPLKRLHRGYF